MSDKPLPTGQVLESVGYGFGLTNSPHRVIESEGFKEALSEIGLKEALIAKGITPEKIAEKVSVLLEARSGEHDDFKAIDKGLKHATAIYGVLDQKPPAETNKTTYNFIFSENVQSRVHEINAEIKKLLTHAKPPEESVDARSEGTRSDSETDGGTNTAIT